MNTDYVPRRLFMVVFMAACIYFFLSALTPFCLLFANSVFVDIVGRGAWVFPLLVSPWWRHGMKWKRFSRLFFGLALWGGILVSTLTIMLDEIPSPQFVLARLQYFLIAAVFAGYPFAAYFTGLAVDIAERRITFRNMFLMRRDLKYCLAFMLAGFVLLIYMRLETEMLTVAHYEMKVTGGAAVLSGLKTVLVSDLHLRGTVDDIARLDSIVEMANAEKADFIFLLGDYIGYGYGHENDISPKVLARHLGRLRSKYGVYACLGNHDQYLSEQIITEFKANGIVIPDGGFVTVTTEHGDLNIAALRCYFTKNIYQSLEKVSDSWPENDAPTIVLSHSPDYFRILEKKFDIMYSGHTHGGQVRFPLYGAVSLPSHLGMDYLRGEYSNEAGAKLYITCGIGYSALPFRFMNIPEIVVVETVY